MTGCVYPRCASAVHHNRKRRPVGDHTEMRDRYVHRFQRGCVTCGASRQEHVEGWWDCGEYLEPTFWGVFFGTIRRLWR